MGRGGSFYGGILQTRCTTLVPIPSARPIANCPVPSLRIARMRDLGSEYDPWYRHDDLRAGGGLERDRLLRINYWMSYAHHALGPPRVTCGIGTICVSFTSCC